MGNRLTSILNCVFPESFQQPLRLVYAGRMERGRWLVPHRINQLGVLRLSHFHSLLCGVGQSRPDLSFHSFGLQKGRGSLPRALPGRLLRHSNVHHDHSVGLVHHPRLYALLQRHDEKLPIVWASGRPKYHRRGYADRHQWFLRGDGHCTVRNLGHLCCLCHCRRRRLSEANQRAPNAEHESVHVFGTTTTGACRDE